MNTQQIFTFGKKHILNFVGVFPLNKVPYIKDIGSFVFNTHTQNLSGEHWIAVHVGFHCVDVFDPLGFYYPLILTNYIHAFNRPVHYNRIMYQQPDLPTCGQNCVMWLSSINNNNECHLINNNYGAILY